MYVGTMYECTMYDMYAASGSGSGWLRCFVASFDFLRLCSRRFNSCNCCLLLTDDTYRLCVLFLPLVYVSLFPFSFLSGVLLTAGLQ